MQKMDNATTIKDRNEILAGCLTPKEKCIRLTKLASEFLDKLVAT